MNQGDEGVEPKIFDSFATIVSDIYCSLTQDRLNAPRSIKLAGSLPLFHLKCLPGLKSLLLVKQLPHHTRLMVCRLIEDMEQWQSNNHLDANADFSNMNIPAQNASFVGLIRDSTSNASERSILYSKFSLICSLSNGVDEYHREPLMRALDVFEVMPVTLLDSVFDLVLTCLTQQAPFDELIRHFQWIRNATEMWSELDQLLLRSRLVELSRIMVAQHRSSLEISQMYETSIPDMFKQLTYGVVDKSAWSVGSAAKEIEILCVALERDLEPSLALDAIRHYLSQLKPFFTAALKTTAQASSSGTIKSHSSLRRSLGRSSSYSTSTSASTSTHSSQSTDLSGKELELAIEAQDSTMRRAFDYAIACVNSYHPSVFLEAGFDSIVSFSNTAFGESVKNDSGLLNSALLLGTLFVQQKSDPGSLVTFFQSHMVDSFSTVISWHSEVSLAKRKKLFMDILDFGFSCVQAGNTNRYKFFCWFMPPIYTQVSALSGGDENKVDIVSEIVATCLTTLQKGNDIDLLLRDGVPMVLDLFKHQPSQIAPTLRLVATKLLQHNNFWSLLQMNFCLQSSKQHFKSFASEEAIENFFRYLISKGQRKAINAANEVCVAHLSRPQFYGVRNYIFASFEPDLEEFQSRPTDQEDDGTPITMKDDITEEEIAKIDLEMRLPSSDHPGSSIPQVPQDVDKPLPRYIVNPKTRLSMDAVADLLGLLNSVFQVDRSDKGVMKIIRRLLEDVRVSLEEHRFDSHTVDAFRDHLSRVLLFKNLFPQLLAQHAETQSPEFLANLFLQTFPSDVIRDDETMATLSLLGTRIDRVNHHLQKFQHVATATTNLLSAFFEWKPDGTASFPSSSSSSSSHSYSSSSSSAQASSMSSPSQQIYYRRKHLRDLVFNMPANQSLRSHLVSVGYHTDFFAKDLEIRVDIDDRRNLDDLFKTTLSTLYSEYLDILKELYPGIKHVHYEGADVPMEDYFVENHRTSFTVEDLRARRNHIIKLIDKKLKAHSNKINLQNRKLSLLTREEGLEDALEKDKLLEGLTPPQRRRYWVRLNNSYWKVAACCGKQISGCYAPNGDHAEKVLENALKANTCFISLYESKSGSGDSGKKKKNKKKKSKKTAKKDEKEVEEEDEDDDDDTPGLELENIEVLYTDQGLYVFKLYTNGHNLDTTLAWLQFFKVLASSRLVPAIIIPNNFPNVRIFNQLETFVPTQVAGSIITLKDSFFEEFGVTSYYDIPVEKIKLGDIVLDEENASEIVIAENVDLHQDGLKSSGSRSRLIQSTDIDATLVSDKDHEKMKKQQKRSRPQQDLSGMVLSSTIRRVKQKMNDDVALSPFMYTIEAFVRYISQYLSLYLEKGIRDKTLISVGLDLETWNRRKQVKSQAQLSEATKNAIIDTIAVTIHEEIEQWMQPQALCRLFSDSRAQFFELRSHWQQLVSLQHEDVGNDEEHPIAEEMVKQRQVDIEGAKRGVALARSLMGDIQTTLSLDRFPRLPLEQVVKSIFGNEDRVWRERGGRPGEETLAVFLNFCRYYEEDPKQLTQAQQQVRLSTQAQQELARAAAAASNPPANPVMASIEPQSTSTLESALETQSSNSLAPMSPLAQSQVIHREGQAVADVPEDESLSSFKGHHYGNPPWGGFVTMASLPEEPGDDVAISKLVSSVVARGSSSNRDVVAYCIGDYIAPDDFEVVTAWVHPNYRSFGLALELYKRTAYRLWNSKACFVTFDMLLGTVEHLTKLSPALNILHKLGILQKIIVKRRNSHSSETEHGTERFERLTVSLRWMVLAFKIMDLWTNVKVWVSKKMYPARYLQYPWKSWFLTPTLAAADAEASAASSSDQP